VRREALCADISIRANSGHERPRRVIHSHTGSNPIQSLTNLCELGICPPLPDSPIPESIASVPLFFPPPLHLSLLSLLPVASRFFLLLADAFRLVIVVSLLPHTRVIFSLFSPSRSLSVSFEKKRDEDKKKPDILWNNLFGGGGQAIYVAGFLLGACTCVCSSSSLDQRRSFAKYSGSKNLQRLRYAPEAAAVKPWHAGRDKKNKCNTRVAHAALVFVDRFLWALLKRHTHTPSGERLRGPREEAWLDSFLPDVSKMIHSGFPLVSRLARSMPIRRRHTHTHGETPSQTLNGS